MAGYPDARFGSVDAASGKVSGELFRTGSYAMLFAMIAISIYIWFRFEWQFGIGALFALVHDVALTFGFFALTQFEFDLNLVAALLTIIGSSLNETTVIRSDERRGGKECASTCSCGWLPYQYTNKHKLLNT